MISRMSLEDDSDVYESIGRGLRRRRLAAGLTLDELGELSSLGPAYIGQIERNAKKPSLGTLAALARALDVPLEGLLKGSGPRPRVPAVRQLELLLRRAGARERAILLSVVRHLARELRDRR